jgi:hypothetical protein
MGEAKGRGGGEGRKEGDERRKGMNEGREWGHSEEMKIKGN